MSEVPHVFPDDIPEFMRGSPEAKATHTPVNSTDPFPFDCFPEPLNEFISAVSDSIGCDPSFVGLPSLTVCGAAIGNTARLRLKHGFDVPPVIWSVIIGESGTGKTPAFNAAMRPLEALQEVWLREHAEEMKRYRHSMMQYRRSVERWKTATTDMPVPVEPEEPVARRAFASDTTVQALAKLLSENPRGLLLAVEELDSWFGSFDKFSGGAGSDAAQWLQLHTAGTLTVDRKGDGVLSVPNAAVCVLGGIQPGIIRQSLTPKHRKSGMSPRLLKCFPERHMQMWSDTGVDPSIELGYFNLIESLYAIDFDGKDDRGKLKPHIISLSAEAKCLYAKYHDDTRREQSGLTGEMSSALDKLIVYAARFALIFHNVKACGGGTGDQTEVDGDTMKRAVRLAEWLKREAKRVHAVLDNGDGPVETVDEKALRVVEKCGGKITARDLGNNMRAAKKGAGEEILNRLVEAGHGSWEPTSNGQSRQFVMKTCRHVDA